MGSGLRNVLVVLSLVASASGCGDGVELETPAETETETSVQGTAPRAEDAEALRAEGRVGLTEALAQYDAADRSEDPVGWERFVDQVAGARDASTSRLYWETDLQRAKAEAKRRGLPILSLRMLGDLREELSCANSRLFRTLLYADPKVAALMDEAFVLHWSTERPVPQVEIRFGDGRSIKTTTTGNSIHYVLDADGEVLDAIPGLYSPRGFEAALRGSSLLHAMLRDVAPGERSKALRDHHRRSLTQAASELAGLRAEFPLISATSLRSAMLTPPAGGLGDVVPALTAQPIALGKSSIETPTLQAIEPWPGTGTPSALQPLLDAAAATRARDIEFSKPTLALIERDRPMLPKESDAEHERRIRTMLDRLRADVARDELQNAYNLRAVLHEWFADGLGERSFEAINARVYEELFLTPADDAWLGLVQPDVYDGLVESGVSELPG